MWVKDKKNNRMFKRLFKKTIYFLGLLIINISAAQTKSQITIEQYIDLYKDVAVEHMKTYKIPASIKLAQAILESSWGNSELAVKANNHFGIKCHNDWKGETMYKDDDAKNECFRKYIDPIESFNDHSIFLSSRNRYASLFELDITDYKGWANGLKQAGYATNSKYPELLINLIEKYNLNKYDTASHIASEKPVKEKQDNISENNKEKRKILINNRVKYIIARKGDTFLSLATELQMGAWQFYRYNDLNKNDHLKEGQLIYLQPKRRHSFENEQHIVTEGETLYDISQKYAIKIKHLHRLNPDLHPDGDLVTGQIIKLKKKN